MATIITFPAQHSDAYEHILELIQNVETAEALNFYMRFTEATQQSGYLAPEEAEELYRLGRVKRLERSKPEPIRAPEPDHNGTYVYTPEMGEEKPACQMESSLSYYGDHYCVDTPLELKGRGITKLNPVWMKGSQKEVEGWNSYRVTRKAYEKLEKQYTISRVAYLD